MFRRKRLMAMIVPAVVLAYFVYVFFSFDIPGLAERASMENARTLVRDTYSYKTVVERDNRSDEFSVAIEGEKKGRYPEGTTPEWVELGDDVAQVELTHGYGVSFDGPTVTMVAPGYGDIVVTPERSGLDITLPEGDQPEWLSVSNTRLDARPPGGRLTVTKSRTEVHRYFAGWELFWFTLDSPYHGRSWADLIGLTFSDDRVDPARSNAAGIWEDFWHNPMWRHSDVAWAIFETVLMAFLGTFGAAIVALPLAFLSAKNFTPAQPIRFAFRRVFDFLRGVDGLIWTVILARAFGPGPMTGSLAILLTDTGSFGKMFSEALENVDDRQIEGVRSTGASNLKTYRFGVIPQVTPVLLSQVLYYLESNTRSATVIGAIVGGGIGLMLTQAIITQKDWEEVTYYIVLIVLMVMLMDSLSGWLRRRFIKGGEAR
jgi:phosphonate transport system permease protein